MDPRAILGVPNLRTTFLDDVSTAQAKTSRRTSCVSLRRLCASPASSRMTNFGEDGHDDDPIASRQSRTDDRERQELRAETCRMGGISVVGAKGYPRLDFRP